MRTAQFIAAAAIAGGLFAAPMTQAEAQGLCPSDMGHLMSSGACHARKGCLRTHLQLLSKSCLAKISFRIEQRMRMRHHMS